MLHIDIVELNESENELSPDHARRARDLRSFIAKVRDDPLKKKCM